MGAFINLNSSSVANFTITPPEGYIFPEGLASCMGALQGVQQADSPALWLCNGSMLVQICCGVVSETHEGSTWLLKHAVAE